MNKKEQIKNLDLLILQVLDVVNAKVAEHKQSVMVLFDLAEKIKTMKTEIELGDE